MTPKDPAQVAYRGSRVYTRPVLSIYDLVVFGFSSPVVWQCPTQRLVDFYTEHISANHLDVGVGTGYLLDRCRFPAPAPRIALLDLNRHTLNRTARRIARYQPTIYQANVLEPLPITTQRFDSIGLGYVLHCLPVSMEEKGVVFQHLRPLLHEQGVLFGTTLLGRGVRRSALARTFMAGYNLVHAFSNREDDRAGLERILTANFRDHAVHVVGCVAFFVGRP